MSYFNGERIEEGEYQEKPKPESPTTPVSVEEAVENIDYPKYEQAGGDKNWEEMTELEQVYYNLRKTLDAFEMIKTRNCWLKAKLDAQQFPSLTVDIVEALIDANPYKTGGDIEGSYYAGWENCITKLRELIASRNTANTAGQ